MGVREAVEAVGLVLLVVLGSASLVRARRRRRHRPPIPPDLVERVATATEASEFSRILVPTLGGILSDQVVLLACKLARPAEAQVEVLYVVEVPLAMPSSAELPEEMAKASEALTEAELIGRANDVLVRSRVEKGRFAGKVIVDVARATGADLIIVGAPTRARHGEGGRTVEYVLRNAPCDVMIERGGTAGSEQRARYG